MNAQPDTPNRTSDEPSVAGVRVRPAWSIALYALLVASAALALLAQRASGLDARLATAAPWVFLTFVIGFAIYRVALVAARRYSPFKAFLQIFLSALFFVLLVMPRPVLNGAAQGDAALLAHADARVRAVTAEVWGWRGDQARARELVPLLDDADQAVRLAAHRALVRLNGGNDLGEPPASREAWRTRFP